MHSPYYFTTPINAISTNTTFATLEVGPVKLDPLNSAPDAFITTAAAVTALITLFKYGKKLIKFLRSVYNIHTKLLALADGFDANTIIALKKIAGELSPNGGSSLLDKINRIEKLVVEEKMIRRQQMSAANMSFWEFDKDGLCTFASRELSEIVGLPASEILGNGWVTNILETERKKIYDSWLEAVAQKRAYEAVYSFVHYTGKVVTVQGSRLPLLNNKNELLGFVGVLEKVSEQ